jgi:hypothetical protein
MKLITDSFSCKYYHRPLSTNFPQASHISPDCLMLSLLSSKFAHFHYTVNSVPSATNPSTREYRVHIVVVNKSRPPAFMMMECCLLSPNTMPLDFSLALTVNHPTESPMNCRYVVVVSLPLSDAHCEYHSLRNILRLVLIIVI